MKIEKKTNQITERDLRRQLTKFSKEIMVKEVEIENDNSEPRGKIVYGDNNIGLTEWLFKKKI